jgi:prepilin-type N-terminal cleavage/methylation domain-containing protein
MASRRVYINKGFTLIEILVVIGIIVLLFAAGSFVNIRNINSELLRTERATLVSVLEKARGRAMNNIDAKEHGVHIDPAADEYVLFEVLVGSAYDPADPGNEEIGRNKNVDVDLSDIGTGDIIFHQLSGEPYDTGEIKLKDTITNTEVKIIIREGGLIDW